MNIPHLLLYSLRGVSLAHAIETYASPKASCISQAKGLSRMGRNWMVICWMAMLLLMLCSDVTLCRRGSSGKKANKNKNLPPNNKPNSIKTEPVKIPGTLCYTGQLLDIKLEPEDAKYYANNFKKFPDCVYYPRCFQSLQLNTTKDMLASECFNVTVSLTENKLDLSEGKNTTNTYARIMGHVINHLCANGFCCQSCSLSLSIHSAFHQLVMLCLMHFISLTVQ
nr:prion-like protein doppel [Pelodiscus sinensis]|eukprot:XP_014425849.1 prion-like protein doppel [Pelodiscus sinensis]